jgi:hypothetical protein
LIGSGALVATTESAGRIEQDALHGALGVAANGVRHIDFLTGCAIVLTFIALRDGILRPRPEPRRCPSCGRRLWAWTCSSCTHARGW